MAEYKGIKGFKTQNYATDPAADQWAAATWTAGGALSRATRGPGGGGTNTAGLMVGGTDTPNGAPAQTGSEEYNGSTWASSNNCNNAMWGMASCGSQTAFNKFAGYDGTARSVASEEYDGTSWSTITNYPQTASDAHGCGTQTASLIFGGMVGPGPGASAPSFLTETNSWTGSAYVAEGSMSTGRYLHGGTGTETAGLCVAGQNYPPGTKIKSVEEYNGTSWTEVNDIPATASSMVAGGTQTAGMIAGGDTTSSPDVAAVTAYSYDGTSWTSIADMPAGKYQAGATKQAANTDMVVFGGTSGGPPADTTASTTFQLSAPTSFSKLNEGQIWYNTTGNALKYTAGIGTWASGTAMSNNRRIAATAQTAPTTAAQIANGGPSPASLLATEQYNGTAWSEVNNMLGARFGLGGTGTQTNAIGVGGYSTTWHDLSESWNGTSWTEGNNLLTGRYQVSSAGTGNTSALIAGGEATPGSTTVAICESYNGTSWTESNDLNTARYGVSGGGTQTAALAIGGQVGGPGAPSNSSEEFDGTSWTQKATLNTGRGYAGAAVTDTSNALYFAGGVNPGTAAKALTESYDGTAWTEVGDLGTGRAYANGAGVAIAALCLGGGALPAGGALTEEWTIVNTIKTVTIS